MLKTRPLNALLAQSISEHVSSAMIFTPSGNLLASATSPTSPDAKRARVHAALAANIWNTYERVTADDFIRQALPSANPQDGSPAASGSQTPTSNPVASLGPQGTSRTQPRPGPVEPAEPNVKTLTLEFTEYNLHIEYVSPRVLLAMIGRRQANGQPSSGSSQHSNDGSDHDPGIGTSRTPAGQTLRPPGTSSTPTSGAGSGGGALGVLKVTAETLAEHLRKELKDFEPPEDL